jgi:hypothetical protein
MPAHNRRAPPDLGARSPGAVAAPGTFAKNVGEDAGIGNSEPSRWQDAADNWRVRYLIDRHFIGKSVARVIVAEYFAGAVR